MKELVRRKKIYSVVDPSFSGDPRFAELSKLYGNEKVASKQLKMIEGGEYGVGSIFVTVWGDSSGADEVGFEFVYKGERKAAYASDMIQEILEDVIQDLVDDLEDEGIETTRRDCRVFLFDQNGQFVPIEPDDSFFAEEDGL